MPSTLDALPFDNRFAQLPERLFTRLQPTPVKGPELVAFNETLGKRFGIDRAATGDDALAQAFSGNHRIQGSDPLAAAYAGHQFGHWAGTLGDGRAILLGEVNTQDGQRLDLQLKGAGRTPYSRGGDGRAWVGPVIREYLISNAMPHYGVPSTTALAAVLSGEHVLREQGPLPGAVLTRVARSHVRVGTFEYLASQNDVDGLRAMVTHLVEHHYAELLDSANQGVALLNAVIVKQAELIARWQALGFIHGVMNTDNASMVGDTIDYGPCAFMDGFDRAKVFSSIDQQGRYAYQNQPRIGHWNMAMLAQSMLPVLADDSDQAVANAQAAVDRFPGLYAEFYRQRMNEKLGIYDDVQEGDMGLIEALLNLMHDDEVDFTLCFRHLSNEDSADFLSLFSNKDAALTWHSSWQQRLGAPHDSARMNAHNPAVIPRNHWVEATIKAAVDGDWELFNRFETALQNPFEEHSEFSLPPLPEERVRATFCGT